MLSMTYNTSNNMLYIAYYYILSHFLKKQIKYHTSKKHVLHTPQLFISLTDITEGEYVLEILKKCCTNPYDIPFKT